MDDDDRSLNVQGAGRKEAEKELKCFPPTGRSNSCFFSHINCMLWGSFCFGCVWRPSWSLWSHQWPQQKPAGEWQTAKNRWRIIRIALNCSDFTFTLQIKWAHFSRLLLMIKANKEITESWRLLSIHNSLKNDPPVILPRETLQVINGEGMNSKESDVTSSHQELNEFRNRNLTLPSREVGNNVYLKPLGIVRNNCNQRGRPQPVVY